MRHNRADLTSEYVHLTQRGIGRTIIFEDNADYLRYLRTLKEKSGAADVTILAWCLMPNHVHLLVRAPHERITKMMQCTGVSYAQYYNGRHGHVGKVFQNRFNGQAVLSEAHLYATIRYIHRNPDDIFGEDALTYKWSSYREIVGNPWSDQAQGLCDTDFVLGLFGGLQEFVAFHEQENVRDGFCRIDGYRQRIDDNEARMIAVRRLGENFADHLKSVDRAQRDSEIALLKDLGLSVRQIERLTGVGRGIIARA